MSSAQRLKFVSSPPCEALKDYLENNSDSHANKSKLDRLLGYIQNIIDDPNKPDIDYHRLSKRCLKVSRMFTPWNNAMTDSNKVYFAKKNGLQLLVYLLQSGWPDTVVEDAGSVMWNFAGSEARVRAAMGEGALLAMLKVLSSPNVDLQLQAIGALCNFMDFEDVQRKAADEGMIELLIPILKIDSVRIRNEYHVWLHAIGSLCYFSLNANTRRRVIDAGIPEILLNMKLNMHLSQYIRTLALGGIMLDVDCEEKLTSVGVIKAIEEFLESHTSNQIAEIEKEVGTVWLWMDIFYQLCQSHIPTVQHLGAFVMNTLGSTEANRKLMVKEGLVPYFVALSWYGDSYVQEHMKALLHKFLQPAQHQHPECSLPAPSLLDICVYNLRCKVWTGVAIPSHLANDLPSNLVDKLRVAKRLE